MTVTTNPDNSIVQEANAVSGYADMSPEQQHYLQVKKQASKLYEAREKLRDLQTIVLKSPKTPEDDLKSMRVLGEATTIIQDAAKLTYYQKVKIEDQHPQFKEEAKAWAKAQKQNAQAPSQTHSL